MKKLLGLLLLLGIGFAYSSTVIAATLPENAPEIGVESTDTDFYSHWQAPSFGANRIGDQGVAMALTSGFGLRAGMRTAFDVTDFEMSLDLSYVDPNVAIVTFFGPQGSYISGNGAYLSIDFMKHSSEANKYLVAINVGSGLHNQSLPEFVPAEQPEWEDNNWVGYQLVAENDIITLSIKENGENTVVTINGTEFTVASSTFYQDFPDKTNAFFLLGALNFDGSIQTVTSNYMVDAARKVYYQEDGLYETYKQQLTDLENGLLGDLTDVAHIQSLQAIKNQMDITTLYSYDQNYFADRNTAALNTLSNAVLELGGDIVLDELEAELVKFETNVSNIADYTSAMAALNQEAVVVAKVNALDTTEFTESHNTRLAALNTRVQTAQANQMTNIEALVEAQVSAFETSVEDLTTIEKVNLAVLARNTVSSNLLELLNADTKSAFEARIATATTSLDTATNTLDGWRVGSDTYVIQENDGLSASFIGNSLDNLGNGIFYEDEKFDIRNFTMTLDIRSLTSATGGWFSFGIMEKSEMFSNADDVSVQDNKGLFFLVIPTTGTQAKVEVYQISLYSNRFFDAIKQETLTIDISKDVEVLFSTEMKDVSGVIEEYMVISIGGQKLMGEAMTTKAIKTSLSDYEGYLYLSGNGGSANSSNSVNIKSINGFSPFAETLVTDYLPEMYVTANDFDYKVASTDTVSFDLYTRGLDLTVKLGDDLVSAENYTYANNRLELSKDYLDTLAEGSYTINLSTAGSTHSISLDITTADPVVEVPTGLSTGALIAIISGAVVAIGCVTFVLIKRKK